MYNEHEVNILIVKKMKKAFKGSKKHKQELRTFEKIDVAESEEPTQSLDESDASSQSNASWSLGSNGIFLDNTKHSRKN